MQGFQQVLGSPVTGFDRALEEKKKNLYAY